MFTLLIYAVLLLLAVGNALSLYLGYSGIRQSHNEDFLSFQRLYLAAYCIIMLADWLQGPYLYRLYAHYGYLKEQIAALYIAGFASSMFSGPLLGRMADHYGRRRLSLVCCGCFVLACVLKESSNFFVLILSSVVGGASTSLLFSAFESWMVAEHNQMGFPSEWLGRTYTLATLSNSMAAVVAGVAAFLVADCWGGHHPQRPFLLAAGVALVAMARIASTWKEHVPRDDALRVPSRACLAGLRALLRDPRVCFLGLVQALFESAMYAFVFLWTGSVDVEDKHGGWHPPLGLIFGSFMLAVMGGSSLLRVALASGWTVAALVRVSIAAAAGCLAVGVVSSSPPLLFLAFVGFEGCCGVYLPGVGLLRAQLLPDFYRAAIMGWMRVPLNMIVIFFLFIVSTWSHAVLFGICTLLCLLSLAAFSVLSKRLDEKAGGDMGGDGSTDAAVST